MAEAVTPGRRAPRHGEHGTTCTRATAATPISGGKRSTEPLAIERRPAGRRPPRGLERQPSQALGGRGRSRWRHVPARRALPGHRSHRPAARRGRDGASRAGRRRGPAGALRRPCRHHRLPVVARRPGRRALAGVEPARRQHRRGHAPPTVLPLPGRPVPRSRPSPRPTAPPPSTTCAAPASAARPCAAPPARCSGPSARTRWAGPRCTPGKPWCAPRSPMPRAGSGRSTVPSTRCSPAGAPSSLRPIPPRWPRSCVFPRWPSGTCASAPPWPRRSSPPRPALGVRLTAAARNAVHDGFPSDDAFDAAVGVLGMVAVLRGCRPAGPPAPADPPAPARAVRTIEGWILGVG